MAYDATKDETVWECDFNEIHVAVCRYNGGPVKVQLSRIYEKEDGSKSFGKTGRLTMEEFESLCNKKGLILVHR